MAANSQQKAVLTHVAKALKKASAQQMLNVIGEGGTGKSWLIGEIQRRFAKTHRVVVTATTGLAASNIGGRTIHKELSLKLGMNEEAESLDDLHQLKCNGAPDFDADTILIIDESSMIGHQLFKHIKAARYKLLILFGDKQQLPPVKEARVDFKCPTIELTEQMRTKDMALYRLISDYRTAKEQDRSIDILSYVDHQSVKLISMDILRQHFHSNPHTSKKIISYTNDAADDMVTLLQPKEPTYRLNNAITVYDGENSIPLAMNGEEVTIHSFPKSWSEANQHYVKTYEQECPHMMRWAVDDFPVPVVNAILKDIPTRFVKLYLGRESIIRDATEQRLLVWKKERQRLIKKFGTGWRQHKDTTYIESARKLMSLAAGVVSVRHSCSLTAHKAQGQTIESVYINLDNIARRDLMYVALSRASKQVILVTGYKA